MFVSKAARRYATALLEVAKELKEVERILEDIKLIDNTVSESKDLTVFLSSPIIKYDDKMEALQQIFRDRVHETTAQFITLLAKKGRANLLDQIARAFIQKYNAYAGIIEIDVYSGMDLSEKQKDSLHEALEKKTGKTVDMKVTLDKSLRGGIAVRIDDTVIDGTVKYKLEELEQQLLDAAIELK